MTDNLHQLPATRREAAVSERSQRMSLPTCLAPAKPAEAVAHLATCLALVRPVGMSDDHAREWLAIAAQDLAEFPADIIEAAAVATRAEVDDHRRIVPTMVREARERLDHRRRAMRPRPVSDTPNITHEPVAFEPMSEDELQKLSPELRKIGLGAGWLTEDSDGHLCWTALKDGETAA